MNKQDMKFIYFKYQKEIDAFDHTLQEKFFAEIGQYIQTRNKKILESVKPNWFNIAKEIFDHLEEEQLKEIAEYFSQRFSLFLGEMIIKYARDMNIKEVDQAKADCVNEVLKQKLDDVQSTIEER